MGPTNKGLTDTKSIKVGSTDGLTDGSTDKGLTHTESTNMGSTDKGLTDMESTKIGSTNGWTDKGLTDMESTNMESTEGSTDKGLTITKSTNMGSTEESTGKGLTDMESTDMGSTGGSTEKGLIDTESTNMGSTEGSTSMESTNIGSTEGSTEGSTVKSTGQESIEKGSNDKGSTDEGSTDEGSTDMVSTSKEDLHWKEESPGTWSRGLDAAEAHYINMGSIGRPYGREFGFLTIIMKIDFGGADPIDSARNAWLAIRQKYPSLASSIDGHKRVYRTASDLEIQSWLEETFITYPERSSDQGAQHLRLNLRPNKRSQLHVLPQSREILLHTGHDVIDGHSMLFFIDSFLEGIKDSPQDLTFGGEAVNLPPPLSLAANVTPATSMQQTQVKNNFNNWFAALPWLSLRAVNTEQPPGNTITQMEKFTTAETKAIITAAKAKGLTPTHVFEAAAILAVAALDPESGGKSYGSCGIFSMRQQCVPRWRESVIPYLTLLPMVIKPTCFEETATQLKAYYADPKADVQNFVSLVEPTFQTFAEMGATYTVPPGDNQMISMSSIGRFEPVLRSVHGTVKLDDLWLMYETPNAVVNSFLWTRVGVMNWQVVYNEVYYEEETIAKWISTTKRILFEGLEIDKFLGN